MEHVNVIRVASATNPQITRVELACWDGFPEATAELTVTVGVVELSFIVRDSSGYEALHQQLSVLESLGINLPAEHELSFTMSTDGDPIAIHTARTNGENYEPEDVIVTCTVSEIRMETESRMPQVVKSAPVGVDHEAMLAFFERYREFGGSVADLGTFGRHLNVFFMLTRGAYTGDASPFSRDEAFGAWAAYCTGAKLGKKEAHLFFNAVDSVHAYT